MVGRSAAEDEEGGNEVGEDVHGFVVQVCERVEGEEVGV